MILQPDFGADLIRALTGREPIMEESPRRVSELQASSEAEKMTKGFVELLHQEIEKLCEVHQVEIDRRFDRLAGRLAELERNVIDMPILAVELAKMARKIDESELALRKYLAQLVEEKGE